MHEHRLRESHLWAAPHVRTQSSRRPPCWWRTPAANWTKTHAEVTRAGPGAAHSHHVGLISHNCIYRQQSIADLYRFKATVAYLVRHCTSWCFLITAEVYFESAPHTNSEELNEGWSTAGYCSQQVHYLVLFELNNGVFEMIAENRPYNLYPVSSWRGKESSLAPGCLFVRHLETSASYKTSFLLFWICINAL